ncbi:LacI family DNA-binding transcriptional regulator [Kribbella monticola]|uniref:LacI family DNA-binding transcriptional regulator n=1 Tax=Kribbella monticola TaxID=2185285 RepID=UPI000DD31F56|nr:LacI family DNA-binding transcriptional regulator [Kribbella monticola]
MVTMQDVATRAGVTKQTVSNVVTGRVAVRPDTAARVRAAIADLGYKPNLVARSLATGTTMTVGLIVPTVASPFYSEIVEEVENVLDEHGYHLVLCTTRADGERAKRQLAGLSSRLVDALLIAGDRDLTDPLALLPDPRFPIALCAWETQIPDSLPVVTIDYEHAGFLAGKHLRSLGHRRVAAVVELPTHQRRLAGFRTAFAQHRVQVRDDMVFAPPEATPAGGFAAAQAALAADPSLTAIFASHDLLALGVLEAVKESGRSVPGDVSVIGFDDTAPVGLTHPALTAVAIPSREMAQQATNLLLRAISEGTAPVNSAQLLRTSLVIRDSTGPAKR